MKIVLFLLLITYIFTADASAATLDLKQGQSLTVGRAGTVTIVVSAVGDMSLKSISGLVLQDTSDNSKTIALTCTFDTAATFSESVTSNEVTCSTAAPESAGSYKLAATGSGISASDGSETLSATFSVVNEPKTLSITAAVEVDPCNGKAQNACTGTCTWNSATSKCVTAEVEVDPCDGKAQNACTGSCSWNTATSKCVTAEVEVDPCDGKTQNACTGTCTWNSTTSKCVTAGSGSSGNSGSGTGNSGSGTNEGSESDKSGFLKLSFFICLFFLFL